MLSHSLPFEINKSGEGQWTIRDYGRGLEAKHLTQNESKEKLADDRVIGNFGVGLKDALNTLYRKNVTVRIKSRHETMTFNMLAKYEFEDIPTLHAEVEQSSDPSFQGTEFRLTGCSDKDIEIWALR